MKTLQRFLIVLGVFVFAYNLGTVIHELGHALNVIATGGAVHHITVTPFTWSYTYCAFDPEPMATSWGGFLWQVVGGLLIFAVLWILGSRLSLVGVVLAVVSLAQSGIYMLVGAMLVIGDSGSLIRMGVPPVALIAMGSALVLLAPPLVLPLGALLGIGRGRNRWPTTAIVFSPVLAYLLVMVAYNLWRNPNEWLVWVASVGGGVLLVVLISLAVHWTRPWFDGPETRRRAIPITWPMCILSLVLGAGIVLAECLIFPSLR